MSINVQEGLRRLATVIEWVGNGLAVVFVLLGFGSVLKQPEYFVWFAGIAAFIWICARGIAWIISGFAQSR